MQILTHTFLLLATSLLFLGVLAEDVPSSPAKHRQHSQRRWYHHHYHWDHAKAPPAGKIPQYGPPHAVGAIPPIPATGTTPSPPVTVPFGNKPAGHCEANGGIATQYWDCCKDSASWPGNSFVARPIYSCAKDGETILESTQVKSSCQGGDAYVCNKQQPFVSPTNPMLSYAVGARPIANGKQNFYGACYSITFNQLPGKTLVFQAVNSGEYPHANQVDLQVPGGGNTLTGGPVIKDACPRQWDSPADGWGRRFGTIDRGHECDLLPKPLQPGCRWRFDWLYPQDRPEGISLTITSMCRVKCPKILTDRTGSIRHDDANYPEAPQ
ncbi:unnamed protein product [Tilletia controversa]|nr:unnamed protein product [Tilletia controversa]